MHATRSGGASRHIAALTQFCAVHFGVRFASKSISRPPGAARLFHQPNEYARFAEEPRQACASAPEETTGEPLLIASCPSFAHCRAFKAQPAASSGLPA